jgi:hypothetical protein
MYQQHAPVVRFLGFNYFYFLPVVFGLVLVVVAWGIHLRTRQAKVISAAAAVLWLASFLAIEILDRSFSALPSSRPLWPSTYAEFASSLGLALSLAGLFAVEGGLLLSLRRAGLGGVVSTLAGAVVAGILIVFIPWTVLYGVVLGCAFLNARCDLP